ncbi:Potassium transporter 5 [Vitis vinifera]|uniref:Potassium transporter 5 n=1 Tax=Vitis vinifera TaxID=29760 RepID=A0A438KHG6_VITVI|nr:Potassium transporter 5 [Vitis vinifera]
MSSDVVNSPDGTHDQGLKSKKLSWGKLRRMDSLDMESGTVHGHSHHGSRGTKNWSVILHLAFQSIGIVYGDIGTSPLYVYASTFTDGVKHNDDILGVLSLIFYTLTLIPLFKYVLIVLKANDNGDGGTFALYSLMCRYAKVGLIPSQQAEDREVSNFRLELPSKSLQRASKLKSKLEKSNFAKFFLLFATMLGTSMVIGDGVLTPCISVLSAVDGIKAATDSMTEDRIVWISVAILVCLFMVQRFGTDKVGYSFAPIICVWFALIGGIGVYNFIKFDPTVVKAINPKYIIDYFTRNKKQAWISLGGIVLAITGTEALFADVGHFTVQSIQLVCALSHTLLLYWHTLDKPLFSGNTMRMLVIFSSSPYHVSILVLESVFCLLVGSFIGSLRRGFSVADRLYWPMFVVAVSASIIASQAMISGTFSIIQQSLSLGCFPRVKIVHTSTKYEGQVYIPEVNYLLMLACVGVTLGFKTTTKIGNAYGIAVVFVMTLTSSFLVLVMIMIWKTHILLVISYVVVIGSIELLYLSSVLYKFDQGGYLPLAFALVLMTIMYIWNDVYRRKYYYDLDHKISPEMVKELVASTHFSRIPGLAIFYSELVHGIPPIFKHYMENVPALHSVLVFVSIKSLPISKVPMEERFLFRRIEGVHKRRDDDDPTLTHSNEDMVSGELQDGLINGEKESEESKQIDEERRQEDVDKDIEAIDRAARAGVVHFIGENEVIAEKGSKLGKKVLINVGYNILKKNLRQTEKVFDIPHKRMLKVGMIYEL